MPDEQPEIPGDVLEHLRELRRLSRYKKELKKDWDSHTAAVLPYLREHGSLVLVDPTDQSLKAAAVVEAETLQVDAGELLDALIAQYQGDIEQATMVWKSTLKAPTVDTADEGLFFQATQPPEPGQEPLISSETVVKVAKYKKSAAYVGFARPGG
jgi:hypothetical protein